MHIGFVTTSFPRNEGDTAGAFVLGMARALVRRGHRVEVVVPAPPGDHGWGADAPWLDGIRVFPAPYAWPAARQRLFFGAGAPDNVSSSPILAALAPFAAASLAVRAARRARGWDAVVSHWLVPSAAVASSIPRVCGRHLAIAHSADVHLLGRRPLGPLAARVLVARADRLSFVSHRLRSELFELIGPSAAAALRDRTVVLPMGFDETALVTAKPREETRRELRLAGFTVLCLGRLVPIKGVDVLLDAVAGEEGTTLLVAGQGPARQKLEKRAATGRATVRFLGEIFGERKASLLAACDAFVVPSRVLPDGRCEGMPVTILEALAAGRPVVATATGAIPEVIEDGVNGLLVPPDDAAGLAGALHRLAAEPEAAAKMAARGRERVRDLSWDALAPRYEALLTAR